MKRVLKGLGNGMALVAILPAFAAFKVACWLLGPAKAFPGWSQAFSLIPGLSGVYLRRAFYRLVLPGVGDDACLSFGTVFSHPTARIGTSVYVGLFCCLGDVTLEDDVLLGSHVSIMNGGAQHGTARLDVPVREQPGIWPHVSIGRDSWIGDRAIVLADIGPHCIVGAGSVVTKPLPDFAIAVGVPAKIVGYRNAAPTEGAQGVEAAGQPQAVSLP